MTDWNDILRQIRNQFGWTQRRVAQEAHVTPGYISRLKKGMVRSPSADMIRNLAAALGVSMEALYSGRLFEGATDKQREIEQERELEALRRRVQELEEERKGYRREIREIGSLLGVAVRLLQNLEEGVVSEEGEEDVEEEMGAIEQEQLAQVLDPELR